MPRRRTRARRSHARRLLDESSSDDDDLMLSSLVQIVSNVSNDDERRPGGSVPGHRVIYRDREGVHDRMYQDYLADNATYTPEIFRRRYMI
jgi:hypothetical protein